MFLLGYEHRLQLQPATSLIFGGAIGLANDAACVATFCRVQGPAYVGAGHVGYRYAINSWLALSATIRARYVYGVGSLFVEVPVFLTMDF